MPAAQRSFLPEAIPATVVGNPCGFLLKVCVRTAKKEVMPLSGGVRFSFIAGL